MAERWMGVQIVANIGDRDESDTAVVDDRIHKELEAVFCDHQGDGDCAIEWLATTVHQDFDAVVRWVNSESASDIVVSREDLGALLDGWGRDDPDEWSYEVFKRLTAQLKEGS